MDNSKLLKAQAFIKDDKLALYKQSIDLEEKATEIADSLKDVDLRDIEYVKGEKGDTGERGEIGPRGETGPVGPKGESGNDGHTPTRAELEAIIIPLIEKPEKIDTTALVNEVLAQIPAADLNAIADIVSERIPSLSRPIRDSLELLQGNERLMTSAIHDKRREKGLDEVLDDLDKKVSEAKTVYVGGGSSSSGAGATTTGAVSSVFSRTGAITAQSGDYTTAQVTEDTNLYFTNARALSAAPAETTTTTGALISGATGKTTPVDADTLGLSDSAASNVLKSLTWANVKATLKTYFDTLYQASGSYLSNIVEDTTPQLGGNLDTQGYTILGGTSTTADLTLQTTSGVGATGADMHFKVGNNGATEALTILDNGNVGIGTTSPASLLHVAGANGILTIEDNNSAQNTAVSKVAFNYNAGTNGYIGYNGDSDLTIANQHASGDIVLSTNGNVGIGTTAPQQKLQVLGSIAVGNNTSGTQNIGASSSGNFTFTNGSGAGWYFDWVQNSATAMRLSTNNNLLVGSVVDDGTNKLQVTGGATISGNVGIGTTSPDYKLDINGALGLRATTTPADPDSGAGVVYMDSTTGDLMTKLNFGGTTKTVTLVDWSVV